MSAPTGFDPLEGEELEEPVCTNEYVSLLRDRELGEGRRFGRVRRLLRSLMRGGLDGQAEEHGGQGR